MIPRRWFGRPGRLALLALPVLWMAGPAVLGGAELVLKDGQVLVGEDVQRRGDNYALQLESGDVLTIPAALVEQVRLTGVGDAPTGFEADGPTVLAGEEVVPSTPADQTEAIGNPSKFRKQSIDPEWTPDSDWLSGTRADDPNRNDFNPSTWQQGSVDPDWTPESVYDPNQDVLADNRSSWAEPSINFHWTPADGFAKDQKRLSLSGGFPTVTTAPITSRQPRALTTRTAATTASAPAPAPTSRGAWGCAQKIFRASSKGPVPDPEITTLKDKRYRRIPLVLYEAEAELAAGTRRGVLTLEGGACQLVGGDVPDLAGLELSGELATSHAAKAYNDAVRRTLGVFLDDDDARLEYAAGVAALIDPAISGHRQSKWILLESAEDLTRLEAQRDENCTTSKRDRKRALKLARQSFRPPRVAAGATGNLVTFQAWSGHDGSVMAYEMHIARDGSVSVSRSTVAAHLGRHDDSTDRGR